MPKAAPPAQALPSPAGALPLRLRFAFVLSSPNANKTTGPATPFKPKIDSNANGNLPRSFHHPRPAMLSPGGCMQTGFVKWIGEQKFVATSPSGHAMTIDSDRASNKAPGPMELLLLALGACTATDVVLILEKKRQKLDSLEVICSGERAAEPPTVWTKLELLYRFRGQLDDAAVKHAIQLSEDKYCSVAAMLRKTATLSWRYEILPPTL